MFFCPGTLFSHGNHGFQAQYIFPWECYFRKAMFSDWKLLLLVGGEAMFSSGN